MAEDDTHIIPPDRDPPPSPLTPGSESAASASRPNLESDPVTAKEPSPRRQATPGTPPAQEATGQISLGGVPDPPPLKPLHRTVVPLGENPSAAASGSASGAGAPPPLAPPPGQGENKIPQVPSSQGVGTPQGDPSSQGLPPSHAAPPVPIPVPPAASPPPPAVPPSPGGTIYTPQGSRENPDASSSVGDYPQEGVPVEGAGSAVSSASAPQGNGGEPVSVSEGGSVREDTSSEAPTTMNPAVSHSTQAEDSEMNGGSKAKPEENQKTQDPPTPASQKQPAYHRSPYEKSIDRDKKNKQLLWALAGSSFVLAVVALLLGLGVLQVNSSQLSSSQIAPGAIGEEQIAPGAIGEGNLDSELQKDIFGKTGPEGPRGPKGDTGPRGAAGLSSLQLINREVSGSPADLEISGVALCQDGQVAISGGALITGGQAALSASEPASGFSGWRAGATREEGSSGSWRIRVYAICATPSQSILDSIG